MAWVGCSEPLRLKRSEEQVSVDVEDEQKPSSCTFGGNNMQWNAMNCNTWVGRCPLDKVYRLEDEWKFANLWTDQFATRSHLSPTVAFGPCPDGYNNETQCHAHNAHALLSVVVGPQWLDVANWKVRIGKCELESTNWKVRIGSANWKESIGTTCRRTTGGCCSCSRDDFPSESVIKATFALSRRT